MRGWLGLALIILPIVVLTLIAAKQSGWRVIGETIIISALIIAPILAGSYLLTGGK